MHKKPDTRNCHFAGHLPGKETFYRKRLRPLAATYITFSPDGKDLLVNLGGEQVRYHRLMTFLESTSEIIFLPPGLSIFRAQPVSPHPRRLQGRWRRQRLVRRPVRR